MIFNIGLFRLFLVLYLFNVSSHFLFFLSPLFSSSQIFLYVNFSSFSLSLNFCTCARRLRVRVRVYSSTCNWVYVFLHVCVTRRCNTITGEGATGTTANWGFCSEILSCIFLVNKERDAV